ncbi:MAG: A24 family peptidase [Solibacillus isronensis]
MELYLAMALTFVVALVISNSVVLIHEEDGSVSTFFSKQMTDIRWFVTTALILTATGFFLIDQPLIYFAIGMLLAITTIFDLKYLLAPDFMNGFIAIAGLFYTLITYKHLSSLSEALICCMILFLAWLAMHYLFDGGIGGGDFKLLMALSFVLGINNLFIAVTVGIFSAMSMVLVTLIRRQKLNEVTVPLVPFLLVGYIVAVKYGDKLIELYGGGGF